MNTVIHVDKISKSINERTYFQNVSLSIKKGETIGFHDKGDGSKSLFLQTLCGEVTPDDGKIFFRKEQLGKYSESPQDVGIAIRPLGFIREFSGYKNLRYIAGMNGKIGDDEIIEAMLLVGLRPQSRTKVKNYSLLMLQKLTIAQAIMEKQDIVILDELFMDDNIKNHQEIRRIIRILKKMKITILIASEKTEFIENICDRGYFIEGGSLKEWNVS